MNNPCNDCEHEGQCTKWRCKPFQHYINGDLHHCDEPDFSDILPCQNILEEDE